MADDNESCPNARNHTKAPRGYLSWHEWAEKMMETHTQIICEGCGRYSIWVPKAAGQGAALLEELAAQFEEM